MSNSYVNREHRIVHYDSHDRQTITYYDGLKSVPPHEAMEALAHFFDITSPQAPYQLTATGEKWTIEEGICPQQARITAHIISELSYTRTPTNH